MSRKRAPIFASAVEGEQPVSAHEDMEGAEDTPEIEEVEEVEDVENYGDRETTLPTQITQSVRPNDDSGHMTIPPESISQVFAIGEVLGGAYEIKSVLGAGAMGQVFEAHDLPLNRRVAIKAAWPSVDASTIRKEAQALAAIRHPCVITVHAVGRHNGIEYVVMERLYGVSLETHMRHRRESGEVYGVAEAVQILLGLAEGLAAVHRAGVAHRDVKPENVMVTPGNRLVLMDFGIFIPEFEISPASLPAGSPAYMAPETISSAVSAGDGHLVDAYALGVIAYELLAGQLPFDGQSIRDVLHAHLSAPIPELVATRADVPPRLSMLVARLMAKEPSDRPETMDDVAFQLRTIATQIAFAPDLRAQRGNDEAAISQRLTEEPPKTASAVMRAAQALFVGARERSTAPRPFRVLIIDDDVDIARLLTHVARRAIPDAEISAANDPEKVLQTIAGSVPDVLLLDLHMPRVNGIEVCMYLRGIEGAERCTIMSVSAGAQPEDVQLLSQLGVKIFIPKDAELTRRVTSELKAIAGRR